MRWLWMIGLALAHHLLQLCEPDLALSLSSALPVQLPSSVCLQSLTDYTLAGWFRTEQASSLLTLHTPVLRMQIDKEEDGTVRVLIGEAVLQLAGNIKAWEYVAVSVASTSQSVSLCVAAWQESLQCTHLSLAVLPLELAQTFVHYGSAASFPAQVLDVLIAPITLSPDEIEYLSQNGVCGEGCDGQCSGPGACVSSPMRNDLFLNAMCQTEALVSGPPYGDNELYKWFDWNFGMNLFYYDIYDFSPNYSTKKVKFELSDVSGDPDMEIVVFHIFRENEWLGESHEAGPDTLTFDWNTPRFRDGIDWTTTMRVYISGKTWFTFYTLLTTYYSTKMYRVGSAQSLLLPQRVATTAVTVQRPVLWGLGVMLVGGVGLYLARRWRKREELLELRTPLLTPSPS